MTRFDDEVMRAEKGLLYQFDDVQVEPRERRIRKAGQVTPVEPKAFDVLLYLLARRGELVTKEDLLSTVWGEAFVTPNAMTRVVAHLRKALGDDARESRYIETVPTRGYRFVAEVCVTSAGSAEPAAAMQAVPPVSRPEVIAARTVPFRSHHFAWAACVLLAVVAILIVWRDARGPKAEAAVVVKTMQFTSSPGLDIYPAFAPDGNSIAYSSDRGGGFEIYVKPLAPGGREVAITSDGQQNVQAAWSPDGKWVAYHSRRRGGIWLVPALGGVAKQLTDFGSRPAWSRNGEWLAFQSDALVDVGQSAFGALPPSTIWVVAAQGGAPRQVTQKGQPSGGHGAPTWSADGQRITFVTYDFNLSSVWSVEPHGGGLRRLVEARSLIYDPVASPDGRYAYVASGPGNFRLWRVSLAPETGLPAGKPVELANTGAVLARHLAVSPDGKRIAYSALALNDNIGAIAVSPTGEAVSAPRLLTQDTNYRKLRQLFSPNGGRIAYSVWRMGADGEVWVMDADGKNARQVTSDPAGLLGWLPDGDRLAVIGKGAGGRGVWAVNLNGGRQEQLSDQATSLKMGNLSPDGQRIVYHDAGNDTLNIWTANLDGSGARRLTNDSELMAFPIWSPDGQWLAFEVKRGSDTQLAVMPSGGGAPEQLTSGRGQSWPGGWSPDGEKVAFAGMRDGVWNVWWVSRRDKTARRVTNYTKQNLYVRYPSWSPRGDQIVYEYAETTGNIWVMELK